MKCLTPTSTAGKKETARTTPSGALSSRQMIALIQKGKWWPFDRVPGEILVKMNAKRTAKTSPTDSPTSETPLEEAPF